jgi:hypothetical protein
MGSRQTHLLDIHVQSYVTMPDVTLPDVRVTLTVDSAVSPAEEQSSP